MHTERKQDGDGGCSSAVSAVSTIAGTGAAAGVGQGRAADVACFGTLQRLAPRSLITDVFSYNPRVLS